MFSCNSPQYWGLAFLHACGAALQQQQQDQLKRMRGPRLFSPPAPAR